MSKYQRSYTPSRSRSVCTQCSVPVAGIPSKQTGVSREPQLPSRKKTVMFRPQTSAIWASHGVVSRRRGVQQEDSSERRHPALDSSPPTAPGQPGSTRQAAEQEASPPTAPEQPGACTHAHAQQPVANGCALRWKAGLRSGGERSKLRRSEYHRQFTWKTAKYTGSPLLNAQKVLYSSSRDVPPFKKNPVAMETEYRRSFQCQTPPRGHRRRKHLERKRKEAPEVKPRPQQEQPAPPPQSPEKTTTPPHAADENRILQTEYLSNFRSPVLTEDNQRDCDQGYSCYKELQDLREKASSYRHRAWGTHFSRNHLNQLLSEYNSLWEASDTLTDTRSDTLTDTRSDTLSDTHASEAGCNVLGDPDEDVDDEDDVRTSCSSRSVQQLDLSRVSSSSVSSKSGSADNKSHTRTDKNTQRTHADKKVQHAHSVENSHTDKHAQHTHIDKHTHSNTAMCHGPPVSRQLAWGEVEPTDEKEGRLPTPTLKVRPVQRTHHDRTTPAIGGAILVSPPKQTGTTDPPLGKPQSPCKHMGLQQAAVAAGMATVDPLPLREEGALLENSPTPKPSTRSTPNRKSSSKPMTMKQGPLVLPPHRIQGMLRDPEFQHNGELGCRIQGAGCGSDEDDRFSVLSWRSAASCSEASAVLERTQRRRDKFWGKA